VYRWRWGGHEPGRLLELRYPDAQPRIAGRLDAAGPQRRHERAAPLAVDALGAAQELGGGRVRQQLGGDLLEDVADPAGAEAVPSLDPGDGPVIDRVGARVAAAGAYLALAAGYAGLALARRPLEAFVAATAAGAGNGGLLPSQSALVASLVPPDLRHRATSVSRVAGNLGMGLGSAAGGLVAASGLSGLVLLFAGNAVTYLLYGLILVAVVREDARPAPIAGGYRVLLCDRPFLRLALTNIGVIAVGWGVFSWIVPTYARSQLHLGARLIGSLLLANALTVVLAQLPVARSPRAGAAWSPWRPPR
jgi:Major Facilitator Superfamily